MTERFEVMRVFDDGSIGLSTKRALMKWLKRLKRLFKPEHCRCTEFYHVP